jgi:hypothetical protein
MRAKGHLSKMEVESDNPVNYFLQLDQRVPLNDFMGKHLVFHWDGGIQCSGCGKSIPKTFGEGFCYPCFISSPQASPCIIRPELCRAHLGEGRDPAWEERNHNQPHVVYLTAGDTVKVGVTRASNLITRWIDQGASRTIVLAETSNRYEAGLLEVALKDFFTDKTSWQKMLRNARDESIDLVEEKWRVYDAMPSDLSCFFSENDTVNTFTYPVVSYPQKVTSVNLEKVKSHEGLLQGVRGQYLLFSDGSVLNIRRHTGFHVTLSCHQ